MDWTATIMERYRWLAVLGLYAALAVFVGSQVLWYFGLLLHQQMSIGVAIGFTFGVLFIVLERRWRYAEDVDRPGFEVLPHEESLHVNRSADSHRDHHRSPRTGDDGAKRD